MIIVEDDEDNIDLTAEFKAISDIRLQEDEA